MSEKGLKFAGISQEGVAKAVKVDSEGSIITGTSVNSILEHLESIKNFCKISPSGISEHKMVKVTSGNDPRLRSHVEDRPCLIQSIFYVANHQDRPVELRIFGSHDDSDGDVVGFNNLSHFDDFTFSATRARNLEFMGGSNGIFKLNKFDTSDNVYSIVLERPIYAPNGFRLRVFSSEDSDDRHYAQMSYVIFDEVD